MKSYKLIIFDKDGTLCRNRHDPAGFINSLDDQEMIPGVEEKLGYYRERNMQLALASNQGGVPMGYMDAGEAWMIAYQVAFTVGMAHNMVLICIDPLDSGSFFRKPNPGMLLKLMLNGKASPAETLYVGDRDEDYQAAQNAGCDFAWAWDFFGREPPDGWKRPNEDHARAGGTGL